MEKLEFNFQGYKDDCDKANALMTFIANRAAAFDKERYDTVIVTLNKDNLGVLTWELCHILNTFYQIKFRTSTPIWKLPFNRKTRVIKWRPRFWINWLRKRKNVIEWDCESTVNFERADNLPKIYSGFTNADIDFIAKTLYHYWSI